MAQTSGYTYGIRNALQQKGISGNQVGFNSKTGMVTIGGKDFIKPGTTSNGVSNTTQAGFNTAWSSFNAPSQTPVMAAASAAAKAAQAAKTRVTNPTAAVMPKAAPVTAYNPVTPQQTTLDNINKAIQQQQQYQFKGPETPFSYDQTTDPAYQAQLAEAKRQAEIQQLDTNAQLRGNGQGKSSYSEAVASQIGNNAVSSIANNLVPQLMAAAYQRYNDTENRDLQVQQMNYGVGQDAISNLANQYGIQNQEYFQNPMAEAELTGSYQSQPIKQAIQEIRDLKAQSEAKGITKEQRATNSAKADQIRLFLDSQGVDSRQFGANVNLSAATKNQNQGVRTLQGQQVDLQNRQANLDAALNVANMTGRVVNPQSDWTGLFRQANSGKAPLTMAGQNQNFQQGMQNRQQNFTEDSFMKEFNERVRSTGVQEALAWAAQNFQEYSYDRSQTETENQNAISNDQWSQTMAYQQVRDQVGDSQWQAQFDEDTRRYGLDYALNQLVTNNQISQSQADSARSDAQLELQQDQFSYGMASDQDAKSQGKTADAYAPYIESVAKYNESVDKLGQPTGQKTLGNPDTVKRSILASGLNDYEQYRLMEMYGLWPSGEPIPPKPKASTNTTLGNLAKKYESSGNPSTIARNAGDIGGASYGTYQITEGTMPGFVSYLKNSGNPLSGLLSGVQIASKAFDSAWKNAAAQNGGSVLKAAEEGFIKQSHFDPAASSIKSKTGVDLTKRSNAVQQVLWSVSVQHGPGGAKNIFSRAGINNKMTDRQIIDAVYKERSANNGMKYFPSSGQNVRNSVLRRFEKEYQDAVKML
jgi:hypothetical protein